MNKTAYVTGKCIGAIGPKRLIVVAAIAAVGILVSFRPAVYQPIEAGPDNFLIAVGAITLCAAVSTALISMIFRRSQAQHWAGNFGKTAIVLACLLLLGEWWQTPRRQEPAPSPAGIAATRAAPARQPNVFDQFDKVTPPNVFDQFDQVTQKK